MRIYERIDEELGAAGIVSYLLTSLEQLVIVHLIKSVWLLKPQLLREILFVKDGPLAFFGVTAPLHKPMRALMEFLGTQDGGKPIINMVGLEKSGPFVEHAMLIEPLLKPGDCLLLRNDYIYRYVQPGDPAEQSFGRTPTMVRRQFSRALPTTRTSLLCRRVHIRQTLILWTFSMVARCLP